MALAVVMAGLALLLMLPTRKEELRPPVQAAALVRPPVSVPKQAVRALPVVHRPEGVKALPKLAVFPTPSPLTVEEQRLMAMVAADPKGTAEAFESLKKRNQALEIAPLVIEPLTIDGGQ